MSRVQRPRVRRASRAERAALEDDPLWYKDAIIYEVHVRSFFDGDGDGAGDFGGLARRLDYLQELGVTALWLLPFCASPGKDDGYDIADFTAIHPTYGTLQDFKVFLREAHRRGLRVITELVVNHTSDQHPWFQSARRDRPGGRWRDYYVWSENPEKYQDARIIFKDFEPSNWSWDRVAKAYYWHRFYAHQPDLNFDNPRVREAVRQVLDFWLDLGVDGLRLDAIPYLFEREGTSCENLPETHGFLKDLRRHVDRRFRNRVLLAEANMWPEDAALYFGDGDECHMAFHFPLMPRLFMAIRREDRFPIIDILQQTPPIADSAQWALFLRNHDELTLEMVTDEDRDYMYRVFAHDPQARINLGIRRRLAPLLGNDRGKIELINSLLFSMPGTPVLYYGDEIGMGDNFYLGDRNGVRTPMQWSADRNAGFSRANPQRLWLPIVIDPAYHYEAVNVDAQQNNPYSLLWSTRRLISFRKRMQVFGRGTIEFLPSENRKVLSFVRSYREESVLVVANLSRFSQQVELDLSAFRGSVPVELFGQTRFPPVGEALYSLALGPYGFYWFALDAQATAVQVGASRDKATLASLRVTGSWETIFRGRAKADLEAALPAYLVTRRWFSGQGGNLQSVEIHDVVPLPPSSAPPGYLTLVTVSYRDGEPDTYVLPLAWVGGDHTPEPADGGVVARLTVDQQEGLLVDGIWDTQVAAALLRLVARGGRVETEASTVTAAPTPPFRELLASAGDALEPDPIRAEQSNSSVVFGDLFILKLFRRYEEGTNPDLEIGRFLTEDRNFPNIAPIAGAVTYRRGRAEPGTLAILQSYVPHEADAWRYTRDTLGRYYDDTLARRGELTAAPTLREPLFTLAAGEVPAIAQDRIGHFLEEMRLLGQRTGELHLALADGGGRPEFSPEPFSEFHQQALYQSVLGLLNQTLPALRQRLPALPADVRADGEAVLEREGAIRRKLRRVRERKIEALRLRCHGHYHLGQVLHTGKDFIIIDFEGQPTRPLGVRQLKQTALRDIASMLRSLHAATDEALLGPTATSRPEDRSALQPWARCWYAWVGSAFLRAWVAVVGPTPVLPRDIEARQILLDAYLIETALTELGHAFRYRPERVWNPLRGILEIVQAE
jgi:maltose alpha-D-glucosyltransferase / alpha-amylase